MFPVPNEGLVISYSYLWRHEFVGGEESGRKNRPCAIVVAINNTPFDPARVAVVPITHKQPDASCHFVELPVKIKNYLGLDDANSWVVCDEANIFDWPGTDMSFASNGRVFYGLLPDALIKRIRDEVRRAHAQGSFKSVPRTS